LATGRTMTIGLHVPFPTESVVLDPYYPLLLEGLSVAAAEVGYGFVMLPASPHNSVSVSAMLRNRPFDGAVVVDPVEDSPVLSTLRRYQVPVVTTGRYLGRGGPPWVDNDYRSGIAELVGHLYEEGYEFPSLMSLRGRFSFAYDLEEGFKTSVSLDGGPVRVVRAPGFTEEDGYREAVRLLGKRSPPDAIIVSGERQALGVFRAARDLGVRVPRELGIAGLGDTLLARHTHPPLTSISFRPQELGEAAVRSLVRLLEGEVPANELLPAELIRRGSTRRKGTAASRR
jgi:DNA-binding LacI/PurR family transcriptional regulator